MHTCIGFYFDDVECCQLCHDREEGHDMIKVRDDSGQSCGEVCHPIAERLRALGYLLDETPEEEGSTYGP